MSLLKRLLFGKKTKKRNADYNNLEGLNEAELYEFKRLLNERQRERLNVKISGGNTGWNKSGNCDITGNF